MSTLTQQSPRPPVATTLPWYRQLTGYHWFVFSIASAAWFFDCLDQRLFSLARIPALETLMGKSADVQASGKVVTAIFLVGWGVGGLIFGALGDRYGRAKMLTLTVLIYSLFTGLSFFSHSLLDFSIFRFLTGVGVGGVFGLAVALIAETVPDGARPGALGMLQVLSTVGNVAAGLVKMGIDSLEKSGVIATGEGWRWMFLVGAVPAFMLIFSKGRLKEPEPWLRAKAAGLVGRGSWYSAYAKLLKEKRWRRNLIVGAVIASTGVVGVWAIGEFAVDLQKNVFKAFYIKEGVPSAEVNGLVKSAIALAFMLQMAGAAAGMTLFTWLATVLGRKKAFALGFPAAMLITAFAYWKMESPTDAYWMMPLMGASQLGLFAGFAIYLPELFPSSLRSTGTSFCYNLGRFAAAGGSLFSAALGSWLYGDFGLPLSLRYAAITMCAVFMVGLLILPFAPETKDKPLPSEA
jgi:MFS family permease